LFEKVKEGRGPKKKTAKKVKKGKLRVVRGGWSGWEG